jgi:hypothetical protein
MKSELQIQISNSVLQHQLYLLTVVTTVPMSKINHANKTNNYTNKTLSNTS